MHRFIKRFFASATIALLSVFVSGMIFSTVSANPYSLRFMTQYNKIHNSANGYFSQEGVPYHSVETMIIEAPDYGHETTSEAFSYFVWLEATYGKISGDFSTVANAWSKLEQYAIPTHDLQPTNSYYSASKPATYVPEYETPQQYPGQLDFGAPVGQDPLQAELKATYNSDDIYGMHWLLDVDNWYGFGNKGDGTSRVSYINTFQRGPQESVWETVTQPSWEAFKWGGQNGYLDLFTKDASYAKQWRYSNAPDADARCVQALYWAYIWAKDIGLQAQIPVDKGAKIGDYLRYCFFDKYFKKPGCQNKNDQGGQAYQSAHYLLSWYYAWGGATDPSSGWAWRIGSSPCHFGYQNPLASYALANESAFAPKSTNGKSDWATSLGRQLEFYQWLQSAEGGIAGGCTNSWNGRYEVPPAGTPVFYGMSYQPHPVYLDPGSNQWFGWQAWSMERLAEYFYVTNDSKARALFTKWIAWVKANVSFPTATTYQIPSTLVWSGQPATWVPGAPVANSNLHVTIQDFTNDVGVTSSLSRTLMYYAAALAKYDGAPDADAKLMAQKLIDRMWVSYADAKGVAVPETHSEFTRMNDSVPLPVAGWLGYMPNGDTVKPGATFLSIRSKYKSDPEFARVNTAIKAGNPVSFTYHRFWAQAEVALAQADWSILFPNDTVFTINSTAIKNNGLGSPVFAAASIQIINGKIHVPAQNAPFVFSLFTCNGQKVFSKSYKGDADLSVTQFAPGAYVANISNNGVVTRKTVMIGR